MDLAWPPRPPQAAERGKQEDQCRAPLVEARLGGEESAAPTMPCVGMACIIGFRARATPKDDVARDDAIAASVPPLAPAPPRPLFRRVVIVVVVVVVVAAAAAAAALALWSAVAPGAHCVSQLNLRRAGRLRCGRGHPPADLQPREMEGPTCRLPGTTCESSDHGRARWPPKPEVPIGRGTAVSGPTRSSTMEFSPRPSRSRSIWPHASPAQPLLAWGPIWPSNFFLPWGGPERASRSGCALVSSCPPAFSCLWSKARVPFLFLVDAVLALQTLAPLALSTYLENDRARHRRIRAPPSCGQTRWRAWNTFKTRDAASGQTWEGKRPLSFPVPLAFLTSAYGGGQQSVLRGTGAASTPAVPTASSSWYHPS